MRIEGVVEVLIEGVVLKVIPDSSKSQAKRERRKRGYEITMVGIVGGCSRAVPEIFILKTALGRCPITRRVKVEDRIIVSADFIKTDLTGNVVFEVRGMEREGVPFGDKYLYPWLVGRGCPVGEVAEDVAQFDSYYTGI